MIAQVFDRNIIDDLCLFFFIYLYVRNKLIMCTVYIIYSNNI